MNKDSFEKQPFIEMLVLVLFMIAASLFFPKLVGLAAILPIIYFLIERRVRKRVLPLSAKSFKEGLKKSWVYILLVGIVFQVIYFTIFKNFVPEMFDEVNGRVTFLHHFDAKLLVSLLVLALGEEITFRGLVQARFTWLMKPSIAIVISSLLFTLMHFSTGDATLVSLDLLTIFIDSVMFGIIFYKTNNIYLAWLSHALANITAAFLLINYV